MLHTINQNGFTLMFAYFYKDNFVQMSNFINVIFIKPLATNYTTK